MSTKRENIQVKRLEFYSKEEMLKLFYKRKGKYPDSEEEFLAGLIDTDFNTLKKHYSLIDFFNVSDKGYTQTSDNFYPKKNDYHKIYMQGGCTDNVNLYYLFNQKNNKNEKKKAENKDEIMNYDVFDKSVIVKVRCGGVKKTSGDGKIYRYYVDKKDIKFIKFNSDIHYSFKEMALHGNDLVYIPDLPILKDGVVVKKPYIMVCGSFSFYLIDPKTLEVVNNNLIYLNGMLNLDGSDPIKILDFTKNRNNAYKANVDTETNKCNNYNDRYKTTGITYDRKNKIFAVCYNYISDNIEPYKNSDDKVDPIYVCKNVIFYRFEDDPTNMSSNNKFITIKPVYLKNGKYIDCNDKSVVVKKLKYNPVGYGNPCGIDTDSQRLFHCRAKYGDDKNRRFFENRIYLFSPKYIDGELNEYELERYFQIESEKNKEGKLLYDYLEIENICYRQLSNGKYRFFIGYKEYKDHSKGNETDVFGTVLYFDYDMSKL